MNRQEIIERLSVDEDRCKGFVKRKDNYYEKL